MAKRSVGGTLVGAISTPLLIFHDFNSVPRFCEHGKPFALSLNISQRLIFMSHLPGSYGVISQS